MSYTHETICIYCVNACNGGCSWSESLTPVEGWTVIENRTGPRVIACPKFEKETARPKTFSREGMIRLAEAVALGINEDYVCGTKAMRKTIEKDLRSGGCRKLLQLTDTENVITQLRRLAEKHDEEMDRKWKP